MPQVSKGAASNQCATTPDEIYLPVQDFWQPKRDLAADSENTKCPLYFDEHQDALNQPWHKFEGPFWLNHPYENCTFWIAKAHDEALLGATIIMLQPLAIHREYYRKYVKHGPCAVLPFNRAVKFGGYKQASATPHALYIWNKGLRGGVYHEYDYMDPLETQEIFKAIKGYCI